MLEKYTKIADETFESVLGQTEISRSEKELLEEA